MIYANDLRKGTVFRWKGDLHIVIEYQHHKPGKGQAVVRLKLKNLIKGSIFDTTMNPEERIDDVQLVRKKMEYLYSDNDYFYFMDPETYEQIQIPAGKIENERKYLKEGMIVEIDFLDEEPLFVHPPMFIELEVVETKPNVKGDTVSGGSKPAVLETGLKITVPLFINVGDIIKVDTRSDKYVERVKKA